MFSVENLTESLKTARQKYLDTGQVNEDMLSYFADNDPSKNYKYTEWMVEQFVENNDTEPEEIVALIQQFDINASKNKIKNKDINQYNLESMMQAIEQSSQEKTKSEEKREIKANDADIVFENDNYLVVVPETYKASCLYGKGTKWCTSATNTDQHWTDYTEKGIKFYYIFDKNKTQDDPMYKIAVAIYSQIAFDKKDIFSFNDYTMEIFDAKDNRLNATKIPSSIPKNLFHNIIYLDNTTKEGIAQICEHFNIQNYTINNDLTVNVDGNVFLSNKGLLHLPLNFGKVGGGFDCSENNLPTLQGAPQEVGGYFDCSENNLPTLQGAPQKVGGGFYCSENNLPTLQGAPQKVGGYFDCRNNNLTKEDIEWLKDNCEIEGDIYD